MKTSFTKAVEEDIDFNKSQLLILNSTYNVELIVLSNGEHDSKEELFEGTIVHYRAKYQSGREIGCQISDLLKSEFKLFKGVLTIEN